MPMNLKAPASVSRMSNKSSGVTEAGPGPKARSAKAPLSFSRCQSKKVQGVAGFARFALTWPSPQIPFATAHGSRPANRSCKNADGTGFGTAQVAGAFPSAARGHRADGAGILLFSANHFDHFAGPFVGKSHNLGPSKRIAIRPRPCFHLRATGFSCHQRLYTGRRGDAHSL